MTDRPSSPEPMLRFERVAKSFVLHTHHGVTLPVLDAVDLTVAAGEAVVLTGPSGSGKSTVLRLAYGNYKCLHGRIWVRHGEHWTDLAGAEPHEILDIRQSTIGYVSQFLRVVPRVSTLAIVSEPLLRRGQDKASAEAKAATLLTRLKIPEPLWGLSPLTFSGGEQQRVNIAQGFVARYPVLLLDEPTASLDAANRQTVVDLIREAAKDGSAILGIFHDPETRGAIATREIDVVHFQANAA